jgi:hypothetical protein
MTIWETADLDALILRDKILRDKLCGRFRLAQEATGLRKGVFAQRVGLSPAQLSNIFRCSNSPPRFAIAAAVREFGFTTNFFYFGDRAGMRDPDMPAKLRSAAAKLGVIDY